MTPALYLALGDSISIDDYPEKETGTPGIGAASLFARDLAGRFPQIRFLNLTVDGATTEEVLRLQLPQVRRNEAEAIVTITAGGNDMLMNLRSPRCGNLRMTGRTSCSPTSTSTSSATA